MTIENKFPLRLDLQAFADGDEIEVPEDNIEDNPNDTIDGETELFEALKSLADSDDDEIEDDEIEDDETDEPDDKADDETEDDLEENPDEEDDQEGDSDEEKGRKREQSKEENAKFAAQRRQKELDDKVQAELDRLKSESPEFKLAKQLSEMYGAEPEVILNQMKEAALEKEAADRNVPIELLRERQEERQRLESVEAELNQLRFTQWESRIEAESTTLQSKYTMLDKSDMDAAVDYILNTVQNVDLPLEQAVYALHGQKIIESLSNAKVQEDLAKQSGRKKKTPLSPNNGKPSDQTKSLTADEKYIAKQLGMSTDDYLKYKS